MQKIDLADNAMTTLATVKELLEIPAVDDEAEPEEVAAAERADNNLTRLINAASAWVETQTGRKLGRAEYTERLQGSGTQELVLQQWPILSVEYVKDLNENEYLSPGSYDYSMTGETGTLYSDAGWTLRGYRRGLADDIISAQRYLEVKYTAGYILPWLAERDNIPATLPADLQAVVWGIVEQEFFIRRNGAQGLSAFSISDISWTFDKEPRPSWLETIRRHMRW